MKKRLGQFLIVARLKDSGFICLAGRNGSGKSSLLKMIAGFLAPDEGHICIGGREVANMPVETRGVVLVTPGSFIPHLDVDSHLRWGSKLKGRDISAETISKVKAELGIDFKGPVSKLSLGMRERVALATAVISLPELILVDEAFANLDDKDEFLARYRRLSMERSIDVIFATQSPVYEERADHLYNIDGGVLSRAF